MPRVTGLQPVRWLGSGGSSTVWEVERGGERFALKLGHEAARERLRSEARALEALAGPGVVRLHQQLLDAAGQPSLLLELLEGETLAERIAEGRATPADVETLRAALEAIHRRGWAWGDLKPENVVFGPAGVTLIDFGLAERLDRPPAETQVQKAGTAHYMAPELWEGAGVTALTDCYALGAVAFEVLSGLPPFVGTLEQIRDGHLHRRWRREAVPAQWRARLEGWLAKRPERRALEPAVGRRELKDVALAEGPKERKLLRRAIALVVCTPEAARALAKEGGTLLALAGGEAVVGFCAVDPVLGLGLASRALERVSRSALFHVAEVELFAGQSGWTVAGLELQLEQWRGSAIGGWTPAALRQRPERVALAHVPYLAHQPLVEALATEVTRAFESRQPLWCLVHAEPGTGRTRLLEELAARVGQRPGCELVRLDDAERVDPAVLAQLEARTLAEQRAPIAVVAVASAAHFALWPQLGERAARRKSFELPAMDPKASSALARGFLAPAEFLPQAWIDKLVEASEGRPAAMEATLDALVRSGQLISDAGSARWRLEERKEWALTPGADSLAALTWRSLPKGHAELAFAAATLGDRFEPGELASLLERLDPRLPLAGLDLEGVLPRLVKLGLLRAEGQSFAFSRRRVRELLLGAAPPELAAAVHRAVLAASPDWPAAAAQERRVAALHALGRSGEAWPDEAALARRALDAFRPVEAQSFSTAALAHGATGDHRRELLLIRAQAGRHLQQLEAALVDLGAALSGAAGAIRQALLLERATLLDWLERYDESAEVTKEIERAAGRAPSAAERLAIGRARYRRGELEEAIDWLTPVLADADRELPTVAGALVGCCEAMLDRLDAAEQSFAHAQARATALDDWVHVGVIHTNRVLLSLKRGSVEGAIADLEHAVRAARQAGHATIERWSSHNLAQFLVWRGRLDEALPLARRAHQLAEVFFAARTPISSVLLLARVEAELGDLAAARRLFATVPAERPRNASDRAMTLAVASLLGEPLEPSERAWVCEATDLAEDDRFDLLRLLLRRGADPRLSEALARARPLATRGLFVDG